jgi:hypothetical protein
MILENDGARLEYDEHPDLVRVWNLESEDPKKGFDLCLEMAKIANGRPIWISVDPEKTRLVEFYIKAGFQIQYLVMVKQ